MPFSPNLELEAREAKKLESEHKSLSDESSEFLGLEIEINHKMNDKEYSQLPEEIQDLCRGLPTYNVTYVKTELSMDIFVNDQIFDTNHSEGNHFLSRSKRQAVLWSTCSSVQSFVYK